MNTVKQPLLEARDLTKLFGSVIALNKVSARFYAGEVTCLLGDNGAGKSTLIKILCGVHRPTEGEYLFEGEPVHLNCPRDALDRGIATVYQDLALIPLMPVWRNFFLGCEPETGWGPARHYDIEFAKRTVREHLAEMGVDIRDTDQAVGTMSGGERQCLAISRAVYFGAKVLILDEPTASLGVKQASIVLHYVIQAKRKGLGVIFISHNPNHAYPVGDHFIILRRGQVLGDYRKEELAKDQLMDLMAGGEDLKQLQRDLERFQKRLEPTA